MRNNYENVRNLLSNFDIICLQELMLCKSDLHLLNELNVDFENVAFVKDREAEGIVEGRPSRGVAIFWRKSLSHTVSPLIVDDSIIGIIISNGTSKILLMNVYLPCDYQTYDALDNYRCMLAKLEVVIRDQNIPGVIITGDFNADPFKGRFWQELLTFKESLSLLVLDRRLPQDTFTYLCPSKNTTSWLDHVLCTKDLADNLFNVQVDYNGPLYDHFPVHFTLEFDFSYCTASADDIKKEFVNWNKISDKDKHDIQLKLDNLLNTLNLLDDEVFNCKVVRCNNKKHKDRLDEIFRLMKEILLKSTENFRFIVERNFKIIPGWNDYLKDIHANARHHFLLWVKNGRPLEGVYLDNMKYSRSLFKNSLDRCRSNEDEIKQRKIAENFMNKKFKQFWRDVKICRQGHDVLPISIDKESDSQKIANNFSEKYKKILDKNQNGIPGAKSSLIHKHFAVGFRCQRLSKKTIKEAISLLKCSIGGDGIHSNHLKFCTDFYVEHIAMIFSSFFNHEYCPVDLLKGMITPTVKDRYGSLNDSNNYRPVMTSSVFMKIFEYCLLFRIKPYVKLNDRQHGFRETYSTNTACFVLKETIFEYIQSNSRVYAGFLDLSKAFDNVSHEILLMQLYDLQIPAVYVNTIKYCYSNQFVKVLYQTKYSEEWLICNGVRQGGVLSGFLFNIYINNLLDEITQLNAGCRLGLLQSNIIAYADDIVLLAPSSASLQILLDAAALKLKKLDLVINEVKSKVMVFSNKVNKPRGLKQFFIEDKIIHMVNHIRYLGYEMNEDLSSGKDIDDKRSKFYSEFNQILRKFTLLDKNLKLFLFRQFCLQIYGAELWFGCSRSSSSLKQFAVGYHKAIKKLLGFSTHEGNHYSCEQAQLLIFRHLLFSVKVNFFMRLTKRPCSFVRKSLDYLFVSSVFFKELYMEAFKVYGISDLLENDIDAIQSRIIFIQNHETPLR